MQGNAQRVIGIPELLISITQELDVAEHSKLMQISKCFFHYVGPTVWECVPRLEVLMNLVDGVSIEPEYYPQEIILPSKPDLSRYNIYSPWVHELEIFGKWSLDVINLEAFLTLLSGFPPLPNLRRLTAYLIVPMGGDEVMNFINMFINPTLTEIRTIIPEGGLPKDASSRLSSSSIPAFLQKIKETCPQIRVLEFYPESADSVNSPGWYTPTSQCRSILSSFSDLRSFSSTTCILETVTFGILGELPYLESLGIRGSPTEYSILDKQDKPWSIPETWFPVLTDLRLYDVHPEDIRAIWSQPTIVEKLASVLIQTDYAELTYRNPFGDLDWTDIDVGNWLGPFLASLTELSPHLQDATLYVGRGDERYNIPRNKWKGFLGMSIEIATVIISMDHD